MAVLQRNALLGILQGKFIVVDKAVGMAGGKPNFEPVKHICNGSVTVWEALTCWECGARLSPAFQHILLKQNI
jgi:hypothetical protein